MVLRAVVEGCGGYLPDHILTNDELEKMVDTSDAWITERTGIKQRHIAAEGQVTSDLAVAAAQRAMKAAGCTAQDIDLVIVATTTPDKTFPSTASIVQGKLGIRTGAAFDVQAVCSGFVYALSIVEKFLACGQHKRALLIGAETMSRILNWEDRSTCVLFGDGAGAFIMGAQDKDTAQGRGVLSTHLACDGSLGDLLYVDGGVSETKNAGHIHMQGNRVFKEAVTRIASAMQIVAAAADIEPSAIDWFVPHQANQRILHGVARKLALQPQQVVSTIERHGNTSAASIPLAFTQAVEDGRIARGHTVMLEAMGGGLTWGAALLRY